jgi:SPRY domain
MATVGQQLTAPEAGWKRYDNTDINIMYSTGVGSWVTYTDASLNMYKHTGIQNNTKNSTIKFRFYGTKFRIIGRHDTDKSNNIKVEIDGLDRGSFSQIGTPQTQILNYESEILPLKYHDVVLTNMAQGFLFLDAIDINKTGWFTVPVGKPLLKPDPGTKRLDHNHPFIAYSSGFADYSTSAAYGGSYRWNGSASSVIKFSFYGTLVRIIGIKGNSSYTSQAELVVDGVVISTFSMTGDGSAQVLMAEAIGLEAKKHDVEIRVKSGATAGLNLDAIDIDEEGDLMGVGLQLTAPDQGWKRYEESNSGISYSGTWVIQPSSSLSGGNAIYAERTGINKAKFDFYGTKLRILGVANSGYHPDLKIVIDGVQESYSAITGTHNQGSTLQYEKLGLELKKHSVEIYNNGEGYWWYLDAIDIDKSGRLFHPDEVMEMKDLQIGKRIRANYVASSNTLGTVSGLGAESKPMLSTTPSTTPNGDFYFIMVDTDHKGRKILISDRNIQSGITMDVLNTAGIASGSGLPSIISDYKDTFLVGGGASASHNTVLINGAGGVRTDRGVTSGKWYWEAFVLGSSNTHIGIANSNVALSNPVGTGAAVRSYAGSGVKWNGSSVSYGSTYTSGDVIGISLDMEAGILTFYKNGVSQGAAFTDLKSLGTIYPLFFNGSSSDILKAVLNFGHIPFKYEAPLGYSSLVSTPTHAFTLRLLTGGISPNDKDNEWDKYMTDDRIWNNVNHGSWTSTTDQSNPKARVIRGYNGLTNWTSGTTDLTTPGRGFRPVLLIEPINNNRFLILDGTDVKTYTSSGWETVGTTPPTDDMFLNKGMLDLGACAPFLKDLNDKSNIKILVSKPRREPAFAHLTGVPVPRIVKMKNDTSFLGVAKINSLTLSGTEKGILRIAISTDSGTTWEAKQKDGSWTTVDATNPIDFKSNAMTIDDFNSISEWDEKIGQARNLRCAFYFEQSSSTDETSLDSLAMDVDLLDSWDMAMPGVDYKYGYNRNTNLRVLLLSNGDYKINVGSGGGSGSTLTEVDGGNF